MPQDDPDKTGMMTVARKSGGHSVADGGGGVMAKTMVTMLRIILGTSWMHDGHNAGNGEGYIDGGALCC